MDVEASTIPRGADAALVAAVRRGDRPAFGRLVERHKGAVFGLCRRLLGNADEARDAAQEAFVRAFERLGQFDSTREFGAWVAGIARNHCLDRLRRRGREIALKDGEEPPESATPPRSAEAAIDEARALAALDRAIDELPVRWREVVVLHHLQGRTTREVAAIVGAPEGTVMTWLYRARRALHARLAAPPETAS